MKSIKALLCFGIICTGMCGQQAKATPVYLATPAPERRYASFEAAFASLKNKLKTGTFDVLIYNAETPRNTLIADAPDATLFIKALRGAHEIVDPSGIPLDLRRYILFRDQSDRSFLDLMIIYSTSAGRSTLADVVLRKNILFRGKDYTGGERSWEDESLNIYKEYQLSSPDFQLVADKMFIAAKVVDAAPMHTWDKRKRWLSRK